MTHIDLLGIATACGKPQKSGDGYTCQCPAHPDSNPSLSISEKSGKLLVHCFSGCDPNDVLKEIRDMGYVTDVEYDDEAEQEYRKQQYKTQLVRDIWQDAVPITHTLAETYLRNRGYLGECPDTLRYESKLYHAPTGHYYPALIGKICTFPSDEVSGVIRIYLNAGGTGKADIQPNKMMLGDCSGGAVRFGPMWGDTLYVAEGVETALSVYLVTGAPTWATLSTSGMKNILLPSVSSLPRLVIAADNDKAGLSAARELSLQESLKQRRVEIITPPKAGTDFNDLLLEGAL